MQETASESEKADVLNGQELSRLDAYWRAANYLSVGQIYLLDNPLLRKPLKPEHIKPRLLGHWGTTPGLNFIYAHLNRVIKAHDLNVIYICGPGHGGPGMVANTYLEGTYSEIYPSIGQDADGMRRLFRQFSFPGASRGRRFRQAGSHDLQRTVICKGQQQRTCARLPETNAHDPVGVSLNRS
jgi:xylulose-5-phosphate/fructose-6-phosphate phosphoketolase